MLEAECHDKLAAVYKRQPKRAEEAKSAQREVARLVSAYCYCYYYIIIIIIILYYCMKFSTLTNVLEL
jgi:hypothetical protein